MSEQLSYQEFYAQVRQTGVVPVVVLDDAKDAIPLARALEAGGLPAAEVTFRTAAAADAIHAMSEACPGVLVGAGTVLTVEQARRAVDAGARFLVSPGISAEVLDWSLEQGIPYIPAGVTPTEITALMNRGFEVTKFFPASLYGGLKAIKALAQVFVGHQFMPTGGVSAANLAEFLECGSIIACGGSWMAPRMLVAEGRFDEVEALCAEAAAIVRTVRG